MATTQTFTVIIPSGLSNGAPVLVSAITLGTAQVIHTCHATAFDSVWLTVFNNTVNPVSFYYTIGGVTFQTSVSPDGDRHRILAGDTYTGGTIISVYAGTTNALIVDCDVRRSR